MRPMSVDLTIHNNEIAILTFNRPDQLNALNVKTLMSLHKIIDQLSENHNLRAVLIVGAGEKAFVAGADIKEMEKYSPQSAMEFARLGQRAFVRLEKLPFIVVGCVNGFALGGGLELALACDFIIAKKNAKFGQPEVHLGIIPGFGGCVRLARRVGIAKAKELIFSGKIIGANEACRIGICDLVEDGAPFIERCIAFIQPMLKQSSSAISNAKHVVQSSFNILGDTGFDIERLAFGNCFSHSDRKEGIKAFLEKREPVFE